MCNCAFLIVHCNVLSCNAISCTSIHCNATGNALSPVQYLQRIHISTRHAKPPLNCFSNVQCPPSTIFHTIIYSTLWATAALTIPAFSVPRARIPPQWPDHRMCMNSQFLIYLTGSPPEFHTHNSENTGVQTKFAKNATRNKKAMKSKSQLRKVWKLSK